MARLARSEVFDPRDVAIFHAMNRVVRRCFLLGDDPVSGTIFGAPNKTAQAETWTDVSGKFSIDAKFAGVETTTKSVVLLKQDGSKIRVPIARLSPESRNQAR